MTNREKFIKDFGYNGSIVCNCYPGDAGQIGSCGYPTCKESCASRHFPRCPYWWDDETDQTKMQAKQKNATEQLEWYINGDPLKSTIDRFMEFEEGIKDALEVLKYQGDLLHKKQEDINKLCTEISELKHLMHDKK